MNLKIKQAQERNYRITQIIAAFVSLVFVVLIGFGYYLLLQKNWLVAVCAGTTFAATAWFIAKYLGSNEKGIRKHPPLFVLLLLISAVGVFNSLMLNFEGKKIFQETVKDTDQRFFNLGQSVVKFVNNPDIEKRIAQIEQLNDDLIKEIMNPQSCGQGPAAMRIIDKLKNELPEFRPLSGKSDCSVSAQVANEYNEKIPTTMINSNWYIDSGIARMKETRRNILASVDNSRTKLGTLRGEVFNNMVLTLLKSVTPKLEQLDAVYRADVESLKLYSPGDDVPSALSLSDVENLGEWSQLINLVLSRLDEPTTYIYLLLSFFFDWMMVYLFGLIRMNAPGALQRSAASSVGSPWARS